MSQVVTELVIDADTSGADRYSRAMDTAQQAMQRSMGAMNDNLRGHGSELDKASGALQRYVAQVLTIGAVVGAVVAFQKLTTSIADTGESARKAMVDVETFQKVVYAMSVSGIDA